MVLKREAVKRATYLTFRGSRSRRRLSTLISTFDASLWTNTVTLSQTWKSTPDQRRISRTGTSESTE